MTKEVATQAGTQKLFYNGKRQTEAMRIMRESAQAARVQLSSYVDDVVFTTGERPWFSIVDGRRTVALSRNVMQKTEAGQLIAGVHELSHARHSAWFGHENYTALYSQQRPRIEILAEARALRTAERHFGGLTPQQRADSLKYINGWLDSM